MVAATCSLVTLGASPALADSCPNAQYRTGPSAYLPDCRAYEMVSPLDKNGNAVTLSVENGAGSFGFNLGNPPIAAAPVNPQQVWQSSADGNTVLYASSGAFAGSLGGMTIDPYLGRRTSTGWTTQALTPPLNSNPENILFWWNQYPALSPDLSMGVLSDGDPDGPLLAPGAVAGFPNLYLENLSTGSYTALTTVTPPGMPVGNGGVEYSTLYQGASAGFSDVLFSADATLTSNAATPCASCFQLYDRSGGNLTAVNILPNGQATPDASAGGPGGYGTYVGVEGESTNAISQDGSVVYWTDSSNTTSSTPGNIYVREDPTAPNAITVPVGAGEFWAATPDGSKAIYQSGSTSGGGDLYEFDLATGQSTDLTPSGDVKGVVGESTDLSYIYFVADAALGSGAQAGQAGQPNLYVYHAGATTFIATLPSGEGSASGPDNWSIDNLSAGGRDSYVTPDGEQLAFTSAGSLTGYPTTPADPNACQAFTGPGPCAEVFYYDAVSGKLFCASCGQSGTLPRGPSGIGYGNAYHTARWMSDDGDHLFFDSSNALVPRDTNGQQDVYEWEPEGTGACTLAGGCQYLISGGTGGTPDPDASQATVNSFVEASADGSNVFFTTQQQLVPEDTDQASDLYDARVDGGFPAPAVATSCDGTDCRAAVSPPPAPAVGSVSFSGPGDQSARVPGRATVITRTVHGTSFMIKIKVPGAGRVRVTGARITQASRSVARAMTIALRVSLSHAARKLLSRTHSLGLQLRVGYTPARGTASTVRFALAVKPVGTRSRHVTRPSRETTQRTGGAR